MDKSLIKLSKKISYALRHGPEEFGLTLDPEGWVLTRDLLKALSDESAEVTQANIEVIIAESSKSRFEIEGDRIRAVYGHSVEGKIEKKATEPPEFLFHGTTVRAFKTIMTTGLKAMSRQYVHFSEDLVTARAVGLRHGKDLLIIRVSAKAAHDAGCKFYGEKDGIWLADETPPRFLTKL
jgi:putative RNA 2'-phosphotransferase